VAADPTGRRPAGGAATSPTLVTPAARRILPWLVAVAFFMESLDTTILNTAVPTIAQALGVAPLSMKAVLASYTLSLALFIPLSGWMANRFGTRRVFACAIGVFTLGSLLCGLSRNIDLLVLFRILQGVGGAMMLPVGRLTMVRAFPKGDLVRAMSFVAIPGLLGPMLGPTAGGLIVAYLHWSVVFFVNVPIGLAGLYLVYRHLPDFREEKITPLDLVGFILFGSGVTLLSYVLEVFGEHSLGIGEMLGLVALSACLLAGYTINSRRVEHPLLQLALFRIRTFRAAVSGSFFARLGIGGIPFLLPLLYQVGFGFTPVQSGLLMVPQAFAAMSLKTVMPRILARVGYRRVLLANTLAIGLIIMSFATIGAETPLWRVVIQLFCFGFATSLQYTSMNTLVYADVNPHQASGASTIASATQQLSMSFGVAISSIVTALFVPEGDHSDPAALIHGLHLGFIALGAGTIVSALIFDALKDEDGSSVSRHTATAPPPPAA